MSKEAVSVTLGAENLLWLRGQAHAAGMRSLSAVLDRLVSAARSGGAVQEQSIRSVVGTVRISALDPQLLEADAAVRALFPVSMIAEEVAYYGVPPERKRRRSAGRRSD